MILDNFDFNILDSGEFLEDSVREEIITPILHELGYKATGENRIVRSKSLVHPFFYIGTTSRKINIIPDYVLYVNNSPAIVLDAKAPNEDIIRGKNVEQAFSYAIHKEIRAWLYALCNGRKLSIFSISDYEPLAEFDLSDLTNCWKEIERLLKPEYFERPYLADFHPDLGMTLFKLNNNTSINYIFPNIFVSAIMKMTDNEYSISSGLKFGDDDYMASFDFDKSVFDKLFSLMPENYQVELELALSQRPFEAVFKQEMQFEISVVAQLTGEVITSMMTNEKFVPFRLLNINEIEK